MIIVKVRGYEFEVKITDNTHCVMRIKNTERWGIPLHIEQLQSETKMQLQEQGYATSHRFVWCEPTGDKNL